MAALPVLPVAMEQQVQTLPLLARELVLVVAVAQRLRLLHRALVARVATGAQGLAVGLHLRTAITPAPEVPVVRES